MRSQTDTQLAGQLAGEVALVTVRLARQLRARPESARISLTQLSALTTLANDGPLTAGQLAIRERVRPPSMTRVVAALEAMGLVQRHPHPRDGRQIIITLSRAGEHITIAESTEQAARLTAKLDQLSPDARATLAGAIDILNSIMDDPAGSAGPHRSESLWP